MPGTVVDASPLNYLICIDAVEVLPRLYKGLCIPNAVEAELSHPKAPPQVRQWVQQPKSWLKVLPTKDISDPAYAKLGSGERAAIALALEIRSDLLIMDDRDAVIIARQFGLSTAGTLAVLDLRSEKELIDLGDAFHKLRQTSFRSPLRLMAEMLEQDARRKRPR